MSENIFASEWIDCLEAHYAHVIRTKDHVTEPSLTIVMHSAGFSDKQLAELRVRATMHVDDVGSDFVPDLHILDGHNHDHSAHDVHAHERLAEPVSEPQIFNIPIDLSAADEVQTVEAVSEVQPTSEEELEADFDAMEAPIEYLDEVPQPELKPEMSAQEIEIEAAADAAEEPIEFLDDGQHVELEAVYEEPEAELDSVEHDTLVEPETEEPDPDAPQQLSLF